MPETSITCPKCKMTSHNPNDVINLYCGNCKQFHPMMAYHEAREAMNANPDDLRLAVRAAYAHSVASLQSAKISDRCRLAEQEHKRHWRLMATCAVLAYTIIVVYYELRY